MSDQPQLRRPNNFDMESAPVTPLPSRYRPCLARRTNLARTVVNLQYPRAAELNRSLRDHTESPPPPYSELPMGYSIPPEPFHTSISSDSTSTDQEDLPPSYTPRQRPMYISPRPLANGLYYAIDSPPPLDHRHNPDPPLLLPRRSRPIQYYSPTEAAARSLYPNGTTRPLIAQQQQQHRRPRSIAAEDKANINRYLRDKYPGDIPVPFGYERRYKRSRSRSRPKPDGCWFDDGPRDVGLNAAMAPRKCFAKRMSNGIKGILGR